MITANFKKRFITSLFLLISLVLIFKFNYILIYSLIVLGVMSILEFGNIINKITKKKIYKILSNLFFIIYITLFCFLFLFFSSSYQLKIFLFSILLCCIASDIGGFITGKLVKGPKLTKISPNKTISGAIGSIFFSLISLITIFNTSITNIFFEISVIAFLTSLANQTGDIIFSYLKRKAKIKNTGNFLPGHGGVLDRIDGILLGLPLGIITLILIFE
jgi:phosphatidate cytidylyltransferase